MKKLIIKFLPLTAVILQLTACIKGDNGVSNPYNTASNVLILAPTGDNVATTSSQYFRYYADLGVKKPGDTTSFNINVSYTGSGVAESDITVNLVVDSSILNTYNTQDGLNLVLPPTSVYKLPSTVVIKKGTKMTQVKASITISTDYNFNKAYGFALKIASASSGIISSNIGAVVYSFGVRNAYDGHYKVTGTFMDTFNSSFTGNYPMDVDLITTGAYSVAFYDLNVNNGTYGHGFLAGGSGSYYGYFSPVFTVDPSSNAVVSVTNYYGQPDPTRHRAGALDATGINKFDPAKHNFDVSYWLVQAGANRTNFVEHFEYLGPR